MNNSFCQHCNVEINSAAVHCNKCAALIGVNSSAQPGEGAISNIAAGARTGLNIVATGLVILSVCAQALLIYLLIEHRQPYGAPGSEGHGYEGMGIIMLMFGASFIVIPGTFISLLRGAWAFWGLFTGKKSSWRFAVNLTITLLPLLVFWTLLWSDEPAPPPPPAPPPSAQEQRVAGKAWAADEGISSKKGCQSENLEFTEGCKSHDARPNAQEQRVAGKAWAMDEGISNAEGCQNENIDFTEGCKSHVLALPR